MITQQVPVEPNGLWPQVRPLGDPVGRILAEGNAARIGVDLVTVKDFGLGPDKPTFRLRLGRERLVGRAHYAVGPCIAGLPPTRPELTNSAEPAASALRIPHQATLRRRRGLVTGFMTPALMNARSADSGIRT